VRHALVELGRLRFGEMGVEEAIREIVQTTHSMFAVDGAGLMLTDTEHHLRSVAASDERFAHLEELQVRHQEGPCIEAFDTKEMAQVTHQDCASARLIAGTGDSLPAGVKPVVSRPSPIVRRILQASDIGALCELEP